MQLSECLELKLEVILQVPHKIGESNLRVFPGTLRILESEVGTKGLKSDS